MTVAGPNVSEFKDTDQCTLINSKHFLNLLKDHLGETNFMKDDLLNVEKSDRSKHLSIERQIESNFNEMNERMLDIDPRSLNSLREIENPSENILNIVKSVLLSLNVSENEVKNWKSCQKQLIMYSGNGLISRMKNTQEKRVKPLKLKEVGGLLRFVKLEDILVENMAAIALYFWVKNNFIHYSQ